MAVIIEDDAYEIIRSYHDRIALEITKLKEKIAPTQSV